MLYKHVCVPGKCFQDARGDFKLLQGGRQGPRTYYTRWTGSVSVDVLSCTYSNIQRLLFTLQTWRVWLPPEHTHTHILTHTHSHTHTHTHTHTVLRGPLHPAPVTVSSAEVSSLEAHPCPRPDSDTPTDGWLHLGGVRVWCAHMKLISRCLLPLVIRTEII